MYGGWLILQKLVEYLRYRSPRALRSYRNLTTGRSGRKNVRADLDTKLPVIVAEQQNPYEANKLVCTRARSVDSSIE